MPRSLNPFHGLQNAREIWAWGMYDLANQSFQLLINTLLFSLFVQSVVVGDQSKGDRIWSLMGAASLLSVVVLSPFVGALADARAWKRELLIGTGVVCAALTSLLAVLQPGQVALAAALYLPAAVACGLGENFLASFLPEISTPSNIGRVSAIGWTMSYVGALVLIAVTSVMVFGLGWTERDMRPLFVFAGVWFFLGMMPSILLLRERAVPAQSAGLTIIAQAVRRLVQSARETRRFRQLARFFAVFFVYSMATQVVVYFLGLIGKNLGFRLGELLIFALVIALAAGLASAGAARFQDRLGHRRTIRVFLAMWVIATGGMAILQHFRAPMWTFWLVSGFVGVALGGIGTSSRALVGACTPRTRAAEFFGIWGMTYKLAGVVGVIAFGQVSTAFEEARTGQIVGLSMLAGLFLTGFLLMSLINEAEGRAVAEQAVQAAPTPDTLGA